MILIGREHLSRYVRQFSSARTSLAMWQFIVAQEDWHEKADVMACFPSAKFLTPKMACFSPMGADCVVTAQIAFNTGILIVLAVTEVESSKTQGL